MPPVAKGEFPDLVVGASSGQGQRVLGQIVKPTHHVPAWQGLDDKRAVAG